MTLPPKTKGQIEDVIAKRVVEFYVKTLGTGPKESKVWIVDDMVIVRLKGKLLPIEEQLLAGSQGIELVKQIRKAFHEMNTKQLNSIIEEITRHKVISTHSDISTKTGERFEAFILDVDYEEELMREDSLKATVDYLYKFIVSRRARVIDVFKFIYIFVLGVLFLGGRSTYYNDAQSLGFYSYAVNAGKVAIVLFILALVPGMMKRFGIKHKVLSMLTIFRRYIGILMYIFVLTHFLIIRLIPNVRDGSFVTPPLFELFGVLAHALLFWLFVTSNDFSVSKLGIWWYRLQRLIYIIMWFVFLHVALQGMSLWTVVMGLTVLGMMASFIVDYLRNRQPTTTSP